MGKKRPAAERFAEKWVLDPVTECHQWTACLDKDGRPWFRDGTGACVYAYVFAWTQAHGPVPAGLVLDHIVCDNPGCVNEAHLTPATHAANVLRGTSPPAINARKECCSKCGGPYSYRDGVKKGKRYLRRYCRPCHAASQRQYRARKRKQNLLDATTPVCSDTVPVKPGNIHEKRRRNPAMA